MVMKNPPHMGHFVREEIIIPLGLTVTAAAKILGMSRPNLSLFLNEKISLSADLALRLEKAFGANMELLMRMQTAYDIAVIRKKDKRIKVMRYKRKSTEIRV